MLTNDAAFTAARTLLQTATADLVAAIALDLQTDEEIAYAAQLTLADYQSLIDQSVIPLELLCQVRAALSPPALLQLQVVVPPYLTVDPTAPTGTPKDGEELTADEGTWVGDATITYAYRWFTANDNAGAGAAVIVGATSSTYTAVVGDVGKYIAVEITASNDAGTSDPVVSPYTAVVAAA